MNGHQDDERPIAPKHFTDVEMDVQSSTHQDTHAGESSTTSGVSNTSKPKLNPDDDARVGSAIRERRTSNAKSPKAATGSPNKRVPKTEGATSPRLGTEEDKPIILNKDDPLVSLAIAYRVKKAYDHQLVEVKHALLREQKRRLKVIESSIPSKTERVSRAVEKRAIELVQRRAEQGRNAGDFLLPDECVPDALEVWAFCGNHEKSLRVKIGPFRDFERAILEQEPSATLDAVAAGLLSVIQQQILGAAGRRLVNEVTWPEVARRALFQHINNEMALRAAIEEEDANLDGAPVENRHSEPEQVPDEIPLGEELNYTPTWKHLEQDPMVLFEKREAAATDGERVKVPGSFIQKVKELSVSGEPEAEHQLIRAWDELSMTNLRVRRDLSSRFTGILNRIRGESYGKLIWWIDYRTLVDPATGEEKKRLSSTREIPALADLGALDEAVRAGLYKDVSSFQLDVRNCFDNIFGIFKKDAKATAAEKDKEEAPPTLEAIASANALAAARAVFEEHIEATRLSQKKFEELFANWVLHPIPFARGPWIVWATTEIVEAEMCRLCKGTRRFPRKSGAPNLWQCKRCDMAYHPDCYVAQQSGVSLPPVVPTTTATNPVGRPKKILTPASDQAGVALEAETIKRDDEDFLCPICTAMENMVEAKEEASEEAAEDQAVIWMAGTKCPVDGNTKMDEAKQRRQTKSGQGGSHGLCGGKETLATLLQLATKLGRCEPADLDVRERLRLLLFLCREAAMTEPCRQEDEDTIGQLKDLQSEFSKHKKHWVDDAQRVMAHCLEQLDSTGKKELVQGGGNGIVSFAKASNSCMMVLRKEFKGNRAFMQRESVRGYISRARAFVERGGFVEEQECRLVENPNDDEIQLTLGPEDEDDLVASSEYDIETDSDFELEDEDGDTFPKLTTKKLKKLRSSAELDLKKLDAFYKTLDPASLPAFTMREATLARSIDVGPPIAKLELQVRQEYLPPNDPRFIHPSMFDDFSTVLSSTSSPCAFDSLTNSPVFFGLPGQRPPPPKAPSTSSGIDSSFAVSIRERGNTKEGAEDVGESVRKKKKKRARKNRETMSEGEVKATDEEQQAANDIPAKNDARKKKKRKAVAESKETVPETTESAVAGGAEGEGKKKRKRRSRSSAGAALLNVDDTSGAVMTNDGPNIDLLATASASCPCCGFHFSQLDRSNHAECQRVFEKVTASLSSDRMDALLAQDLAHTLWQAEHDCIASCLRSEPCASNDRFRFWRFKGDLGMILAEDVDTGKFSRLSRYPKAITDAPLAIKWFLVANSPVTASALASTPTSVSSGKVRMLLPAVVGATATAVAAVGASVARPLLLDDARSRGQLLLDAITLSANVRPELAQRSIFDALPERPAPSSSPVEQLGEGAEDSAKKKSTKKKTNLSVTSSVNGASAGSGEGLASWAVPIHTDACRFCCDELGKDEAHCLLCHATFVVDREQPNRVHTCKALSEALVLPSAVAFFGPESISSKAWSKFLKTKRLLLDFEASLPLAMTRFKVESLRGDVSQEQKQKVRIMVGGWEIERRAMWVDRVKKSVTPLQLLKLLKVLEATIDPRWLSLQSILEPVRIPVSTASSSLSATSNEESASPMGSAEGGGATTTAIMIQQSGTDVDAGEEDPFTDVVVAKVALRIVALDQDIRFECVS